MSDDEIREYNRRAWDHQVDIQNIWSVPVGPDVIARARTGDWSVVLTPNREVPREWFPASLEGLKILALASAGGQQAPIFAAAGADVTVYDASERQLEQDTLVAEREGLDLDVVQGDMADLAPFADECFDLVFHPVSNCFSPVVREVWREVHRVLVPDGILLAGFTNPVALLVDPDVTDKAVLKYSMPYSDAQLPEAERERYTKKNEPLVYAHSLEDQLGGQLDAGLALTHLFEDYGRDEEEAIHRHLPAYIATRAFKF